MRVSFDLDDTLFVSPAEFKTERELKFPFNKIFKERLRYGTISLFQQIRAQNVQLWIYTTSFRSEKYIRGLFKCYGVKVDWVINGEDHARDVQGRKSEPMPSKYPPRYHIDLHIDDDKSVEQNGVYYGFRVFLVGEQDDEWDKKILDRIKVINQKLK